MSTYVPHVSHKLKEFIWAPLGLRYTLKQIYDKHKKICWAQANVGKRMTRDDFLRLQDIVYLKQKHKRGTWRLHTNSTLFIQSWVCVHPNDVFYFQYASEVMGIHVPFTIGIQTPTHFQAVHQFGQNRLISMDVTFGTNDVKYHLFTLMVFDFHQIGVPVTWVIMNWQTCEDLVERLSALRAKLIFHMPNWKQSHFIVDDAPKELRALW